MFCFVWRARFAWHRYGIRRVARQKLKMLVLTLLDHRPRDGNNGAGAASGGGGAAVAPVADATDALGRSTRRLRLFASLCGITDERTFSHRLADLFMRVVRACFPHANAIAECLDAGVGKTRVTRDKLLKARSHGAEWNRMERLARQAAQGEQRSR